MKENIKNWLYLSFLTIFIAILFLTILSFYYVGNSDKVPFYLIFFLEYHVFFMFFIAIIGVVFGSVTQVMTSKKIESDKKNLEILKAHFENSLNKEESKIINYLIQNKGICTQYELTKLETLNKLKVSRLLIDMENKKLLHKEKIGKINKVFLDKELL
ncbi:MAG: hypothetical protein KC589_00155, partial [Nanoarchaeota archaeon]|nr:hypothetical protein [Nanoarchaeota archaeon]